MAVQYIRFALLAGAVLLIAGCAPQAARDRAPALWRGDCRGLDWEALGYSDGLRGLPHVFVERSVECAPPPPTADRDRYDDGYERGLRKYCTPANGYQVGLRNLAYEDVCPLDLAPEFLVGYRRGLTTWALQNAFDGFWFGGVYIQHPPHWLRERPRDRWRHAPRPHKRHWGDRDGRGDRDGERDRRDSSDQREDRDRIDDRDDDGDRDRDRERSGDRGRDADRDRDDDRDRRWPRDDRDADDDGRDADDDGDRDDDVEVDRDSSDDSGADRDDDREASDPDQDDDAGSDADDDDDDDDETIILIPDSSSDSDR